MPSGLSGWPHEISKMVGTLVHRRSQRDVLNHRPVVRIAAARPRCPSARSTAVGSMHLFALTAGCGSDGGLMVIRAALSRCRLCSGHSMGALGSFRASGAGSHQTHVPGIGMTAGTMRHRTTTASSRTAAARPGPKRTPEEAVCGKGKWRPGGFGTAYSVNRLCANNRRSSPSISRGRPSGVSHSAMNHAPCHSTRHTLP